jgi:hypothetical protein
MRLGLGVTLLAVAAGCSSTRAELKRDLDDRASEYLHCKPSQLDYTELDRLISTTKVKVSGCGKDVTYLLVESKWQKVANEPAPR